MALRHVRAFGADFDVEAVRRGAKVEVTVVNHATGKKQIRRIPVGSTDNVAFKL